MATYNTKEERTKELHDKDRWARLANDHPQAGKLVVVYRDLNKMLGRRAELYIPWDQKTWDALEMFHGHMTTLIQNVGKLLEGNDELSTRLQLAAKSGQKMLGPGKGK